MGWFRRRKHEHQEEIFTSEIPLTTMVRWFINDIGYGDDAIDDLIGLSPISEEGATKEAQDSESRLEELDPLLPFIDFISEASANVLATIALNGKDDEDSPIDEDMEEVAEMLGHLYRSVSLSAIIGAFSIASALGLIHITALTSDVREMKGLLDE